MNDETLAINSETARKLLKDIKYATIATADPGGKPWNTPVFCAYDAHSNIYWSSHPGSSHSQNIAASGKVFIVIYNSTAKEGEGVGLYIEATAHALTDEVEVRQGLELLGERRGEPFLHPEKFMEDGPQRIYKAVPLTCWINDADQDDDGDFIEDFRVEVAIV